MPRKRDDDGSRADPVDRFLEDFEGLAADAEPDLAHELAAEAGEVRVGEDPAARAVATAMGVPADSLMRVEGAKPAGRDKGRVFYTLIREGVGIAVRQDGLRAYVTEVLEEGDRMAAVAAALTSVHITQTPGSEGARQLEALSGTWVLVAEGRAPMPGTPERILYMDPSRPGEELPDDTLSLQSMELYEYLTGESIDREVLKQLAAIAVVPGDVVARGVPEVRGRPGQDVFGRGMPPGLETANASMEVGLHVSAGEEGAYRAERFGYLCLLEGRISVLSPVWVSPDAMKAYLVLLDEQAHPVTPEMLQQCLADAQVTVGLRPDKLADIAERVRKGAHERGMFLVAEGEPQADGEDAQVDIRVDLERKAGKVLDDGSIDYRDVNFTPSVQANQLVAQRKPAVCVRPTHVGCRWGLG